MATSRDKVSPLPLDDCYLGEIMATIKNKTLKNEKALFAGLERKVSTKIFLKSQNHTPKILLSSFRSRKFPKTSCSLSGFPVFHQFGNIETSRKAFNELYRLNPKNCDFEKIFDEIHINAGELTPIEERFMIFSQHFFTNRSYMNKIIL